MEAVIRTGGKQYRVVEGQVIRVERLPGAQGEAVEFRDVLLVGNNDQVAAGAQVSGARVMGQVVQQGRARKVTVFKFKRRKNYERNKGHRQPFTAIRITKIEAK
ncbi:MAG TPA: 50S ribosomal protein L21 [Methylomirabilota bacterium]|nr:50S ribosomal protein L21 [Methylomirabilota bacterium]